VLGAGNYFGEGSLVMDTTRNATVVTVTRCGPHTTWLCLLVVSKVHVTRATPHVRCTCCLPLCPFRCVLVSLNRENLHKFFEQVPEALADFEVRCSHSHDA